MITQEYLKSVVHYDPETGIFTALVKQGLRAEGKVLGAKAAGKYLSIGLKGCTYLLHRLAFVYMTGVMPEYVDHINGDGFDNRWSNLRACSNQQNISNQRVVRSLLGFKGVTRNKKRFAAQIMFNYKKIHIGTFDTPEEAHQAYLAKAKELYGEFANEGSVRRVAKPRESSISMGPSNPKDQPET